MAKKQNNETYPKTAAGIAQAAADYAKYYADYTKAISDGDCSGMDLAKENLESGCSDLLSAEKKAEIEMSIRKK